MAEVSPSRPVGGFFPLDFPARPDPGQTALKHLEFAKPFYNARSAIGELIRSSGIVDVLMPAYTCPVLFKAVEASGAKWRTYKVAPGFMIDYQGLSYTAKQGTLVIVNSYFGVYDPEIEQLEEMMDLSGCRVLLDFAQALYSPCPDRFAAVYSPRKFLGVPDGGFLVVGQGSRLREPPVPLIKAEEGVFGERISCHSVRGEYPQGEALDVFRRLERDMPTGPIRMSDLAQTLFKSFDHGAAVAARKANYEILQVCFPDKAPPCRGVPMCFPLPVEAERFPQVRRRLTDAGVFVPHYWPDLPEQFEDLGRTVLALPVDHRYTEEDMKAMVPVVEKAAAWP